MTCIDIIQLGAMGTRGYIHIMEFQIKFVLLLLGPVFLLGPVNSYDNVKH